MFVLVTFMSSRFLKELKFTFWAKAKTAGAFFPLSLPVSLFFFFLILEVEKFSVVVL